MPTPRRSAVLFSEMVADPGRALFEPGFRSEALCRRWLRYVDELVHEDLRKARAAGVLGVRLALRITKKQDRRRIRGQCLLGLALAALASVHRASGDLRRAGSLLAMAERIAAKCRSGDDLAELRIRRSFWTLYSAQGPDGSLDQGLLAESLRLAEDAVRFARSRLSCARANNCRGTMLYYGEAFTAAANDAREALRQLEGSNEPYDESVSLSVLVLAMAKLPHENQEGAARYLRRLRDGLPPRSPELRARLRWTEALVLVANRRRRGRCRRLLSQALATFVRLRMESEAVAVLAELARLRPAGPVPGWCREALKIVDPGPIRDLVERLAAVRMVERVDVAERLRALVTGPMLLPMAELPAP